MRYLIILLGVVFGFMGAVSPAVAMEEVQHITSSSGVDGWLVEDNATPLLSMEFAFDGGMALDPRELIGLTYMASITMDEGAGDIESQEFQSLLQDNSISLSFSAGRDEFFGHLKFLNRDRDLAAELMNLALTEPRFDDEPLERMRAAALTGLRSDMSDPQWMVQRSFNNIIFEGHPYSWPGHGTEDGLEAVDSDDLHDFVKRRLAKDNLHIAAVGDISAEDFAILLDEIFGDLPDNSEPITIEPVEAMGAGEIYLIEEDIPQSIMLMGHSGIDRSDDDWYAAEIMNYILGGGGFNSRLMQELRVKRGLTYGIYSGLTSFEYANMIMVQNATANENVGESLELIRSEWQKMADEGVTEEELKAATDYIVGSEALSMTSTNAIASILLGMKLNDLPIDYLEHRREHYEAVTVDDVNRVAARLLNEDEFLTVIVGQPEGVEPTVILDGPMFPEVAE